MILALLLLLSGDPPSLEQILKGSHRSAENAARDSHRHPAETLAFFGIRPNMTVVEIWPGGGWYAEILAPYLREQGTYIAAGFNGENQSKPYYAKGAQRLRDKFAAQPELYDRAKVTVLDPPTRLDIATPASADMVLTFRNVHNWMDGDVDAVFSAFFRALKPGGVLGVVEHRLKKAPEQETGESGYVSEALVIALAEKAGFRLVEKSELNANPRDTADHPKGVWTLPPTLALKDVDREKYLQIGESDRMTLKFVKP
jgi:predicted methyltransferase